MAIFELETWQAVATSALERLGSSLEAILPSLVATLAILGAGWAVARGVESVSARVLARVGLDRAARRARVVELLRSGGIESPPSAIVGRLLFWVLMLTFVLSAADVLGLTAVTSPLERLVAWLPNVIAAALLLLAGLVLGRLARGAVGSGAAAAGLAPSASLGAAAQSAVVAVLAVLAAQQLGVDTALLVTVIGIAAGAAALTMGSAFALGARPVVTHILAGHFLRESLPVGAHVQVGGRTGTVERVGAVETRFRDESGAWSVPNGRLLEETVEH